MIQIGGTPKRGVAGEDLPAGVLVCLSEALLVVCYRQGQEGAAVGWVDHAVMQGEETAIRDDYFNHLRKKWQADIEIAAEDVQAAPVDKAAERMIAENVLNGLDFIYIEVMIRRTKNPIRRWWLKRKRAQIVKRIKVPDGLYGTFAVNGVRINAGTAVYLGDDGKAYPSEGVSDG